MKSNVKARTQSDKGQAPDAVTTDQAIQDIVQMEKRNHDARSGIDQLSGRITNLAGSGTAILIHLVWFALWLVINLNLVSGIPVFDPFPFSFLTMVVSLEAIFLTLFVLVSQNRMSQEADKRAQLDLQINILAERETTMILRMLDEISAHLEIGGPTRSELKDLLKETRIDELAQKLDDALPSQ
jgi:uncharacterized membrane protein